jgi:sigma-B regulation protein RsbU (phosphoserine phosphatase)
VPLGLRPATQYSTSAEIPLAPGDLLLVTTDGIEEAAGPGGALFGIERTLEVARANLHKTAPELVEALYRGVREFSSGGPQYDDVTAIVVKVTD